MINQILNKSFTFIETFIFILEQKSEKFLNPNPINYSILVIFFIQIFGFTLNLNSIILEKKFLVLKKIIDYLQITPIFRMLSNDSISVGILLFHEVFILFSLFYFVLTTILKYKNSSSLIKYSFIFKNLNQLLNYFFITFNWICLMPIISFLINFIICNKLSILTSDRTNKTDCNVINLYRVIAISSLIYYSLVSFIIDLFIDNYSFLCKFSFLRTYKAIYSFQNLLKILIAILYSFDLKESNLIILFLVIIFAMISIFDFWQNFPFRDKKFCLIYASGSFFLLFSSIITLIFTQVNYIMDYFYMISLAVVFSVILAKVMYEKKYSYIMKMNIHFQNKNTGSNVMSFYLEEISLLSSNKEIYKKDKLKLIFFLTNHVKICDNPNCKIGKKGEIFKENFWIKLTEKKILIIIKEWFKEIFVKNQVDKRSLQILHLKYNTMLINFKDNFIQAYAELKHLVNKVKYTANKNYFPKYFLILLEINVKNVEKLILISNSNKNELHFDKANSVQMKYFVFYLQVERIEKNYLNLILKIIEKKINFWNEMIQGLEKKKFLFFHVNQVLN